MNTVHRVSKKDEPDKYSELSSQMSQTSETSNTSKLSYWGALKDKGHLLCISKPKISQLSSFQTTHQPQEKSPICVNTIETSLLTGSLDNENNGCNLEETAERNLKPTPLDYNDSLRDLEETAERNLKPAPLDNKNDKRDSEDIVSINLKAFALDHNNDKRDSEDIVKSNLKAVPLNHNNDKRDLKDTVEGNLKAVPLDHNDDERDSKDTVESNLKAASLDHNDDKRDLADIVESNLKVVSLDHNGDKRDLGDTVEEENESYDAIEVHYASENHDEVEKKNKNFRLFRAFQFFKKKKKRSKTKSSGEYIAHDERSIMHSVVTVSDGSSRITTENHDSPLYEQISYQLVARQDHTYYASEDNKSVSSRASSRSLLGIRKKKKTNLLKNKGVLHVMARLPHQASDLDGSVNGEYLTGIVNGIMHIERNHPDANSVYKEVKQQEQRKASNVYECDTPGNSSVVYKSFSSDPGVLEVCVYDGMPQLREETDHVLVRVEVSNHI